MKLIIASVQYHAVVLVSDEADAEEASATLLDSIKAGTIQPADSFSLEPRHERDLPFDWKDQEPFVGASISDENYAQHAQTAEGENLSVSEIYAHLYKK